MGQKIWAVLEQYAGLWISVDKSGRVVDHAAQLGDLTRRAGEKAGALTFVFAADSGP